MTLPIVLNDDAGDYAPLMAAALLRLIVSWHVVETIAQANGQDIPARDVMLTSIANASKVMALVDASGGETQMVEVMQWAKTELIREQMEG